MASDHRAEKLPPTDVYADTVIQDLPPQDGSSDGERDERTAREKLKKTSIAGLAQYSKVGRATGDHPLGEVANTDTTSDIQPENGQTRGRPSKKRSFDDLQNEESGLGVENGGPPLPKKGTQHKRMRSREISGDDEEAQGLDLNEEMASPAQEESGADAQQSPGGPGVLVSAPSKEEMDAAASASTPIAEDTTATDTLPNVTALSHEKPAAAAAEAPPSEQSPKAQVPVASGFANASTASPFATFKSPKSPEKSAESSIQPSSSATSMSAFASSGLSAFASSEKSPFSTVGSTAKNSGGFGGGTTSTGFGSSSGGFAAASSFGSKPASGFGSGGGFGSAGGVGGGSGFGAASKPLAGRLSSFASPLAGGGTFAKAKPFGSKNHEDEDEKGSDDGGDDAEGASQAEEDASQDPRFRQQERTFRRILHLQD
jgi:Ran-binding protein 3